MHKAYKYIASWLNSRAGLPNEIWDRCIFHWACLLFAICAECTSEYLRIQNAVVLPLNSVWLFPSVFSSIKKSCVRSSRFFYHGVNMRGMIGAGENSFVLRNGRRMHPSYRLVQWSTSRWRQRMITDCVANDWIMLHRVRPSPLWQAIKPSSRSAISFTYRHTFKAASLPQQSRLHNDL